MFGFEILLFYKSLIDFLISSAGPFELAIIFERAAFNLKIANIFFAHNPTSYSFAFLFSWPFMNWMIYSKYFLRSWYLCSTSSLSPISASKLARNCSHLSRSTCYFFSWKIAHRRLMEVAVK